MNDKIEILKQKIREADAIVVGTASGMSAASGLRFYYQDDDDYKQIAGGLREKYGVHNLYITLNLPHEIYIPPQIADRSVALAGNIADTLEKLRL